jgi:hypothetical protein
VIGGLLVPLVVVAVLAFLAYALLQRGRDGLDLSPRGLLRLYLYVASLAAVLVLAVGLASVVNAALASAFGDPFVYGGSVGPAVVRFCPPGAPGCVEPTAEQREQQRRQEKEQLERRRADDLIRGATFAVFGAVFWGAHWSARRALVGPEERGSPLSRGYLMLGTAAFGLTAVIALPTGVHQALSGALLPSAAPGSFVFRQGAESLGLGLVALVLWLVYLRLAVRELRPVA